MVWHGTICYGIIWHGMVWYCMVRYGMVVVWYKLEGNHYRYNEIINGAGLAVISLCLTALQLATIQMDFLHGLVCSVEKSV